MAARRLALPLALAGGLAIVLLILSAPPAPVARVSALYAPAMVVAFAAAAAYLVWTLPPAITITAGVVLSPLAGNWQLLHVPGAISPQRLALVGGIAVVLLGAPAARGLPRPPLRPTHVVLALVLVYAVVSAAVSETLFQRVGFFRLFDAFGVLPFFVFFVAAVAFRTPWCRDVLLAGLVALGAYLGLTALLEAARLNALVVPHFIVTSAGAGGGRAAGVFLDPVSNGTGLFDCAVAAFIALATWRRAATRTLAGLTAVLCSVGTFFTLERSVWLGTVAAGAAFAVVAAPHLRRRASALAAPAALVACALAIAGTALIAVPGLSRHVHSRATDQVTVWDRQNLATAAENMILARPLFGFGWSTFEHSSLGYFQQSPNFPLAPSLAFSTTTNGTFSIHNELLEYGATLGLVGTAIWLLGLLLAVGGAFRARGAPDLQRWRLGLVPVLVFYLVISNAVPPAVFPNLLLWLWLGVVWSGYGEPSRQAACSEKRRASS